MSEINFNLTTQNFTERAKIIQEIQDQCTRAEKGENIDLKQTAEKLVGLMQQLNKFGETINTGIKITPEIRKKYDTHKRDAISLNARVKALSAQANITTGWVKPVVALTLGVIAFSAFIIPTTGILSSPPPSSHPQSPSPTTTPAPIFYNNSFDPNGVCEASSYNQPLGLNCQDSIASSGTPLLCAKTIKFLNGTICCLGDSNCSGSDEEGIFTWRSGNSYKGRFVHGVFIGNGTYAKSDGSTYTGKFENGNFHGNGTYTWPDGMSYTGNWEKNNRTGNGTLKWPDGSTYTGKFENGNFHGKGTHTWPDGSIRTQKFQNDVPVLFLKDIPRYFCWPLPGLTVFGTALIALWVRS